MSDQKLLKDVSEGDEFIGFYALKRCELKAFEGGSRLDIELSDSSGSVPGVIWDDVDELREKVSKGDVVKVKARLGSYRDKPQVKIDKIRPAEDGEYEPGSFLPKTPCDIDELKEKVLSIVESIEDPHLGELARLIFHNETFMDDYAASPGGMNWHHPYIGGLLEHSIGVVGICSYMADKHPGLNRDLLLVAALLHDVGKLREYTATTVIEYSDEGRLEGHIIIGERFVRNMCDRVEGFPSKLKMLLTHLILAHQGHREFSSPVEPMIPEGFVLYYADEMDAKLNAVNRVSAETRESGKKWSSYVRLLNKYIYVDGGDEQEK